MINPDYALRNKLRALKTEHFKRTGTHGILIPSFKEIERDAGKFEYRVSGEFKLVARRPDGTERLLADFKNLILDAGLIRVAGGAGTAVGNIQLGTGTTTPAAGQTSLAAYSLTINTLQGTTKSYVSGSSPYGQTIYQYRSAVGGATGTFSEIGIGWSSVGNLFSRALILDGSGNPTTITVLSGEQLDVFYTFRWYFPTADTTGTVTIASNSYNWTCRSAEITDINCASNLLSSGLMTQRGNATDLCYTGTSTLGAITSSPSGSSATSSAVSNSYTAGNTYVDCNVTFPLTSNPGGGGIGAIYNRAYTGIGGGITGIQTGFSPLIPKTSSQILTLVTRASIARYP